MACSGRAGLEPRQPERNQAPLRVPRLQEPPPYSWTTLRPTRAAVPQTTPICAAPDPLDTSSGGSLLIRPLRPQASFREPAPPPGLRPRSAAFAPRSARLVMRRSPRSFRSRRRDDHAPGLRTRGATFSLPLPPPAASPPRSPGGRGSGTEGRPGSPAAWEGAVARAARSARVGAALHPLRSPRPPTTLPGSGCLRCACLPPRTLSVCALQTLHPFSHHPSLPSPADPLLSFSLPPNFPSARAFPQTLHSLSQLLRVNAIFSLPHHFWCPGMFGVRCPLWKPTIHEISR